MNDDYCITSCIMRISHTLVIMFVASFFIQYLVMSLIMVNSPSDFTISLGKGYLSVIMGTCMVAVEIMMHDHQYGVLSTKSYVAVSLLLAGFIYLYKKQIAVTDKQYVEEMIEHHSMALLTSGQILEKTDDYKIAKLAKNIIQTQQDEIIAMRDILNDIK
jgi:hypothetical protein